MQRIISLLFVFTLICVFTASQATFAQDSDTLDVVQGLETLNLAVEGDTTETGEAKNPNRVYRLVDRGGYYLLNGDVRGVGGAPLRVVAAKGDGPMPMVIPAVREEGGADQSFNPKGDGVFKGLYVSGIDNLGNQAEKNMFRLDKTYGRYIIDDCFLDHDLQAFVRMNADSQKLFMTNTIMRNSIDIASPSNGRLFDTRGNTQDTVFIQNCTFYMAGDRIFRDGRGYILNFIWDHVTVHQAGNDLSLYRPVNARITNNLFIDVDFEGDVQDLSNPADSVVNCVINMDTSYIAEDPAFYDASTVIIKNNNHAYTPAIQAWFDEIDSLFAWKFINQEVQYFFDTYPKMVAENNISEFPEFSDPPDPEVILTYAKHRRETNNSNENNPDPRADRNGQAALTEDLASMGPAEDEYDFDYPTTKQSYTHAEGGFPLGDLNWFPDKKAEWEEWVKTGIKDNNKESVPAQFTLNQNFPNPFNPSTTITFKLNTSEKVSLTVYNALGQKIRTLVNNKNYATGSHSLNWDGQNDNGNIVSTGIYLYRLQAGDQEQTRKMVFMK